MAGRKQRQQQSKHGRARRKAERLLLYMAKPRQFKQARNALTGREL